MPCPSGPTCRRLAYLIEEEHGIGLYIVEMEPDGFENRLVVLGRPFYFWWDLDGRQMLWHTGGALRHNPEARITLYDVRGDRVQTRSPLEESR